MTNCHGNSAEPGSKVDTCPEMSRYGATKGRTKYSLRADGQCSYVVLIVAVQVRLLKEMQEVPRNGYDSCA